MTNQTTLEHIMAICEEYKRHINAISQTLSMMGAASQSGDKIVEAQHRAENAIEQEAFTAVRRIERFLDQDRLEIIPTCTPNEEIIKKFIEDHKE